MRRAESATCAPSPPVAYAATIAAEGNSAPVVSVIVAARDATATLPRTLECLRRQKIAAELEVIVADDGSSDATFELAKGFGEPVPCGWRAPADGRPTEAARKSIGEDVLLYARRMHREARCWGPRQAPRAIGGSVAEDAAALVSLVVGSAAWRAPVF